MCCPIGCPIGCPICMPMAIPGMTPIMAGCPAPCGIIVIMPGMCAMPPPPPCCPCGINMPMPDWGGCCCCWPPPGPDGIRLGPMTEPICMACCMDLGSICGVPPMGVPGPLPGGPLATAGFGLACVELACDGGPRPCIGCCCCCCWGPLPI